MTVTNLRIKLVVINLFKHQIQYTKLKLKKSLFVQKTFKIQRYIINISDPKKRSSLTIVHDVDGEGAGDGQPHIGHWIPRQVKQMRKHVPGEHVIRQRVALDQSTAQQRKGLPPAPARAVCKLFSKLCQQSAQQRHVTRNLFHQLRHL